MHSGVLHSHRGQILLDAHTVFLLEYTVKVGAIKAKVTADVGNGYTLGVAVIYIAVYFGQLALSL
jgi:hypothetical protein